MATQQEVHRAPRQDPPHVSHSIKRKVPRMSMDVSLAAPPAKKPSLVEDKPKTVSLGETQESVPGSAPKIEDSKQYYIELSDKGPIENMGWSNDPKDMDLNYFTPMPGGDGTMGTRLGLPGLKPILVREDCSGRSEFLLMDDRGVLYLWNEAEYPLWRYPGHISVDELLDLIQSGEFAEGDFRDHFTYPEQ